LTIKKLYANTYNPSLILARDKNLNKFIFMNPTFFIKCRVFILSKNYPKVNRFILMTNLINFCEL
jgi:hypothetical protein